MKVIITTENLMKTNRAFSKGSTKTATQKWQQIQKQHNH